MAAWDTRVPHRPLLEPIRVSCLSQLFAAMAGLCLVLRGLSILIPGWSSILTPYLWFDLGMESIPAPLLYLVIPGMEDGAGLIGFYRRGEIGMEGWIWGMGGSNFSSHKPCPRL